MVIKALLTVKYKDIKSMAHNFSHSFLGWENYVDGDYVVEDLKMMARGSAEGKVSIYWLPHDVPAPAGSTPRLLKSIDYYRQRPCGHARNHGIDLDRIMQFRTDVVRLPDHQLKAEAHVCATSAAPNTNAASRFRQRAPRKC